MLTKRLKGFLASGLFVICISVALLSLIKHDESVPLVSRSLQKPSSSTLEKHEPALRQDSVRDAADQRSMAKAADGRDLSIEPNISPTAFETALSEDLENLPSQQSERLKNVLYLDPRGFRESPHEDIQRLLLAHNRNATNVSTLVFKATCAWNTPAAGRYAPRPFSAEMDRKELFIHFRCGSHNEATVSPEFVLHNNETNADELDAYYFFFLAVFDPSTFTSMQETTITLAVDSETQKGDAIGVYALESPKYLLCFSKDRGRLVRISLRSEGKEYIIIDCSRHIEISNDRRPSQKAVIPLSVFVHSFDSQYFEGDVVPIYVQLQIDRRSIDLQFSE